MPDILHMLTIHASAERVYEALTSAEGIRNWWTRDADLGSEVGEEGEFRFGAYGEGRSTKVGITELAPFSRVGWKTLHSFRPEWVGTTITFDLRRDEDATVVLFAQRGFVRSDETYALCTTGWGYYLVSLQQYLEKGRGAPSPDIDFARMLG